MVKEKKETKTVNLDVLYDESGTMSSLISLPMVIEESVRLDQCIDVIKKKGGVGYRDGKRFVFIPYHNIKKITVSTERKGD